MLIGGTGGWLGAQGYQVGLNLGVNKAIQYVAEGLDSMHGTFARPIVRRVTVGTDIL